MASYAALDKSFASSFGNGNSAFQKDIIFTAFIMDQDKAGMLASALFAQEQRERIHHHGPPVPGIHTERQHGISSSLSSAQSLLPWEANAHEKNRAMVLVYEGEWATNRPQQEPENDLTSPESQEESLIL